MIGGGSGHSAPEGSQQAAPATYQSEAAPPAPAYDSQQQAAPAQFENPCISHNTNLF